MLIIAAAVAVASVACVDDPVEPTLDSVFVIEVSGEQFRVRITDESVLDALKARLATETEGVISGTLVAGDGGFNAPWSWHLDPSTVHVPDLAIELCDGRPSMVEADLTYWFEKVGQYCPWGAAVVGVEET